MRKSLGEIKTIQALPSICRMMANGDFSHVATYIYEFKRSFFRNTKAYVMDSASGVSKKRLALINRQAPETLLGDTFNLPFPYIAKEIRAPDLGPEFRKPVTSDVPTLFYSCTLDGRTPPSNAEAVLENFDNGHHILIHGLSHGHPNFKEAEESMGKFLQGKQISITDLSVPFAFDPIT